jgi:DNA modification methylase
MSEWRVLTGKCEEELKDLADASVDSIVTDPPYELGFMGKSWDSTGIAYNVEMWRECLRVLKPGGFLLSFGGARTYHRMACAIEDAGFEIRDQIMWVYSSGFPKSLDVSKAMDKAAGAEREVIGYEDRRGTFDGIAPSTETARQWHGWGTALKPAHEPIVVARKPLIGTVVANVLAYGTGAMNIDACRIPGEPVPINRLEKWSGFGQEKRPDYEATVNTLGRWPANLIHDGSAEVLAAFPNAPGQQADIKYDPDERKTQNIYGVFKRGHEPTAQKTYAESGSTNFAMKPGARRLDEGSAARFYYCPKASREDRNEGCEDFELSEASPHWDPTSQRAREHAENGWGKAHNDHPTVKPTDLMRYLCRLVTQPGGTVLDPFLGSGSTGKAAILEDFNVIGIEKEPEHCAIAEARLRFAAAQREAETAQQELFA